MRQYVIADVFTDAPLEGNQVTRIAVGGSAVIVARGTFRLE